MRSALSLTLILSLLATSCSKEEAVEPCSSANQENVNAKDLAGKPTVANDASDAQQGLDGAVIVIPTEGGDPDDSGISDDGDDLSDSERVRKKRR